MRIYYKNHTAAAHTGELMCTDLCSEMGPQWALVLGRSRVSGRVPLVAHGPRKNAAESAALDVMQDCAPTLVASRPLPGGETGANASQRPPGGSVKATRLWSILRDYCKSSFKGRKSRTLHRTASGVSVFPRMRSGVGFIV